MDGDPMRKDMRSRRPHRVVLLVLSLLALGACTGSHGDAASASTDTVEALTPAVQAGSGSVRFVLRVADAVMDTVFVQRTTEDRPAAWLTLLNDGERVHFWERCEVPDCGAPVEAVCGARLPEVVALVPGQVDGDSISVDWDGLISRTTESGCEVREPAPSGNWTARFCWGGAFQPMPNAPPMARFRAGYVSDPSCAEARLDVPGDTLVEWVVSQ